MNLLIQALSEFGIHDEVTVFIVIAFLLVVIIDIALRVIVYIGYQTQYGLFTLSAKDIKNKEEISAIKQGVFAKIVKDYVKSCDKGIARVNTTAIVEKNMLRLRFLFWTYESMGRFIYGLENAFLLAGILLAVFTGHPMFFGVFALGVFILVRILAATFDFDFVYKKYVTGVIDYIDREIGQFYIVDLSHGVQRLNTTVLELLGNQTVVLSESIKTMGTDLSGVLRLMVGDIQKSLEDSIHTIQSYGEVLQKPLAAWDEAVSKAADSQCRMNAAANHFGETLSDFKKTAEVLEAGFKLFTENLNHEKTLLSTQITGLNAVAEALRHADQATEDHRDALTGALNYIEKNQSILEESLNKYELALEGVTGKLGDALSSIIQFNIEQTNQTINSKLEENMEMLFAGSNEVSTRLQKMFESFIEQSRSETQAIIRIKEQMDLHFEALNDKIL